MNQSVFFKSCPSHKSEFATLILNQLPTLNHLTMAKRRFSPWNVNPPDLLLQGGTLGSRSHSGCHKDTFKVPLGEEGFREIDITLIMAPIPWIGLFGQPHQEGEVLAGKMPVLHATVVRHLWYRPNPPKISLSAALRSK